MHLYVRINGVLNYKKKNVINYSLFNQHIYISKHIIKILITANTFQIHIRLKYLTLFQNDYISTVHTCRTINTIYKRYGAIK